VEICFGEEARVKYQAVREDRKKIKKEARAALREAGTWVQKRRQERCGREKIVENKAYFFF
jgi:hypothetical protein